MPLHIDESGTALRFRYIGDGEISDVSGAVVKQIWVKKPEAVSWIELTCTFATDGTDGIIQHVFTAAELDTPGVWYGTGYVEMPTWSKWADPEDFLVGRNRP